MNIMYIQGNTSNNYKDTARLCMRYDTCIVDIPSYLEGVQEFKCTSGKVRVLSSKDKQALNAEISTRSGISGVTPLKLKQIRKAVTQLVIKHKHEFYDIKDCFDWAYSELNIAPQASRFIFPTAASYVGCMM